MNDTDQKIIKEFSSGFSGIRAGDQNVYDGLDVEDVLTRRHEDKLVWLRHMEAARKRVTRVESTQMDQMRTFMEKRGVKDTIRGPSFSCLGHRTTERCVS